MPPCLYSLDRSALSCVWLWLEDTTGDLKVSFIFFACEQGVLANTSQQEMKCETGHGMAAGREQQDQGMLRASALGDAGML